MPEASVRALPKINGFALRRPNLVPVLGLGLAAPNANAGDRTIGEIVRLDPRLDHLVPKDAVIEVLADGFKWSEGPVWDREHDRVLFSDIPSNTVPSVSTRSKLFLA